MSETQTLRFWTPVQNEGSATLCDKCAVGVMNQINPLVALGLEPAIESMQEVWDTFNSAPDENVDEILAVSEHGTCAECGVSA